MKYYICSYDYPGTRYAGSTIPDEIFPLPDEEITAVPHTRTRHCCLNHGLPLGSAWPCPDVLFESTTYRSRGKFHEQIASDYLHNNHGWLLVSNRFIDATEVYIKDSVELLDVNMYIAGTSKKMDGYKILNVLSKIDAFDMEKSKYLTVVVGESTLKCILPQHYVLKGDKLVNQHIFTLTIDKENYALTTSERVCFISEAIKKIITKNKFTGFRFQEVEVS